MKHLFLSILFLISYAIKSQNYAFEAGEKLTYTASYNMSGILTDIAEVIMETSEAKTSKATLLRLKCTATTYSKWDNFFKIVDLYESYVNPKNLTPYLYKRDIKEGNYTKFMKYTFDQKSNTIKSVQRKRNNLEENKTFSINPGTKDIVSTLYNIRLIDFKSMNIGSKKSFIIVFDREEVKAQITYLGKESISTNIGKRACYKLAISSSENVLQGKNNNLLWLTADENKIIVYGKFKIPVGTGELKIKSAQGLKKN
jgi:hypothetical protein